ncbi:zinc finger BED domain-containing protein DAYSLEEPER [Daphnia magna]|uniref:zinc finger BED domain-containing protein DAYSLEEPER n=1 Tax=Daphnia magna TaxID=35525 RepID=UPI001E1BC779|nr:zinc finger BED domain-containing protein DAYSLEEPER [Daphnia magna]
MEECLPADSETTIDSDPKPKHGSSKSKTDHSFIAAIISTKTTESKADELKQYVNEETEPSNCDPTDILSYWDQRSKRWPKLSNMARDMLSIPATSAGSERAFSTGKDCFGIARMSLNSETVEALICLRSWFKAGLINEIDSRSHNLTEFDIENIDE